MFMSLNVAPTVVRAISNAAYVKRVMLPIRRGRDSSQFHVLVMDDNIIDLKVFEKLLQNPCYKGTSIFRLGLIIVLLLF